MLNCFFNHFIFLTQIKLVNDILIKYQEGNFNEQ